MLSLKDPVKRNRVTLPDSQVKSWVVFGFGVVTGTAVVAGAAVVTSLSHFSPKNGINTF